MKSCYAQVVLTGLQQQISLIFQVQQLYLGSLFCREVECKPVNSISRAVEGERTQENLKFEACASPAPRQGSLKHFSSP